MRHGAESRGGSRTGRPAANLPSLARPGEIASHARRGRLGSETPARGLVLLMPLMPRVDAEPSLPYVVGVLRRHGVAWQRGVAAGDEGAASLAALAPASGADGLAVASTAVRRSRSYIALRCCTLCCLAAAASSSRVRRLWMPTSACFVRLSAKPRASDVAADASSRWTSSRATRTRSRSSPDIPIWLQVRARSMAWLSVA